MKLAAARRIVLKKYPEAFGWREFTVSDYVIKTEPGGKVLATAYYVEAAWSKAAKAVRSIDRECAKK